jgi:hypothetical protein
VSSGEAAAAAASMAKSLIFQLRASAFSAALASSSTYATVYPTQTQTPPTTATASRASYAQRPFMSTNIPSSWVSATAVTPLP